MNKPRAAGRSGGGRKTVLVFDDEQDLRELLALVLARAGYRVLHAADGPEALTLLRRNRDGVALVIVDALMAHLDVAVLIAGLDRFRRGIPVLVMSVLERGELPKALRSLPFLRKPVPPRKLISIVRRLCRR